MQITAKRKKSGKELSFDYDLPDALDALRAKYGDEVVATHARGSLIVALQGFVRGQLDRDKTEADIRTAVDEWKPGNRKPGKSPAEKAREAMSKLSPEDRAALLKELRPAKPQTVGAQA